LGVIPILEVFAIQGAIRFLVSPYYVWFMVINKTKFLALMSWLELACFLIFAALLYNHGALGLAWARLLTTLVTVLVWIVVGKNYHLSPYSLLKSTIRPLLAGLCMGLAIELIQKFIVVDNYYTLLVLLISTGAIVYALSLGLIWILMGKPNGLEKSLINKIWVRA
jgi:lipopolysaccharide exporter